MESKSIALDVTCTETAPCCLTMTVTVPAQRAKSVYDSTARKISGQVRLPGFRAGKVPSRILFGRYGKAILAETTENLVNESLTEAVREKGMNLAGKPRLQQDSMQEYIVDQAFSFTAELEVIPQIELPEYKGIQVSRKQVEVSDAEVEEAIHGWLEQRSTFEKVDRPARMNDMLKLSYSAEAPEELLADAKLSFLLKAENTWLMLREPEMLPGTQTALLEVVAGEQKKVEIAFPESFRIDALKGKTFLYHFDIAEVHGQVIPELNEKIFQEVGVQDREELLNRVRENLAGKKQQEEDKKVEEQIVETLLSSQNFPLPPSILKAESEQLTERYRQTLSRSGLKAEELEAKIAGFAGEAEQQAARKLRRSFLLLEIGKKENLQPEYEEVAQVIAMMARREGLTLEVASRKLRESGQFDAILANLFENKVLRFLAKEANQVEVPA